MSFLARCSQSPRICSSYLRAAFFEQMKRAGHSLEQAPVKGRRELYKLDDGSLVRLRTSSKRSIMTKSDGPEADSPLMMEQLPIAYVGVAIPSRRGSRDVECFLIPAQRAFKDFREGHAHALASNPNINSTVRVIDFNGEGPGRGFAKRYAEFVLPKTATTETDAASDLARDAASDDLARDIFESSRRLLAKTRGATKVTISFEYASEGAISGDRATAAQR
jgi:hypothetical protein